MNNYKLKVLDLSYNKINEEGLKEMIDCLKKNGILEKIFLENNRLRDRTAQEIISMLQSNATLLYLRLNMNIIEQKFIEEINSKLKANAALLSKKKPIEINRKITCLKRSLSHDINKELNDTKISYEKCLSEFESMKKEFKCLQESNNKNIDNLQHQLDSIIEQEAEFDEEISKIDRLIKKEENLGEVRIEMCRRKYDKAKNEADEINEEYDYEKNVVKNSKNVWRYEIGEREEYLDCLKDKFIEKANNKLNIPIQEENNLHNPKKKGKFVMKFRKAVDESKKDEYNGGGYTPKMNSKFRGNKQREKSKFQ